MQGLNLMVVFCEVLSGLVLISFVIPILDLAGISTVSTSFSYIVEETSAGAVVGAFFVAYMFGLVFDAFGLVLGEGFLNKCLAKDEPSDEERRAFYRKATPQLLRYRDRQWAYASAYRNMLILVPIGVGLWARPLLVSAGWPWLVGIVVGAFFLWIVLLKSTRVVLMHYYDLTKCFSDAT